MKSKLDIRILKRRTRLYLQMLWSYDGIHNNGLGFEKDCSGVRQAMWGSPLCAVNMFY